MRPEIRGRQLNMWSNWPTIKDSQYQNFLIAIPLLKISRYHSTCHIYLVWITMVLFSIATTNQSIHPSWSNNKFIILPRACIQTRPHIISKMASIKSAPIYNIASNHIVAVEHPMIVKDTDKGLKTFGNGAAFSRVSLWSRGWRAPPFFSAYGYWGLMSPSRLLEPRALKDVYLYTSVTMIWRVIRSCRAIFPPAMFFSRLLFRNVLVENANVAPIPHFLGVIQLVLL